MSSIWIVLWVIAFAGSVVWSANARAFAGMRGWAALLAALPGALMPAAFYALALHMRRALGGWPQGIGEQGFTPALDLHARIVMLYFETVVLATLLLWPPALLLCALVRRLRPGIAYLAVAAGAFVIGLGLMLLAPARFLEWWWD